MAPVRDEGRDLSFLADYLRARRVEVPLRANQRQMALRALNNPAEPNVDLIAVELRGDIEDERLARAHALVVQSQPELGRRLKADATALTERGSPHKPMRSLRWSAMENVAADVRKLLSTPINPFEGFTGEVALHVLEAHHAILLFAVHHLACDEYSHDVYMRGIAAAMPPFEDEPRLAVPSPHQLPPSRAAVRRGADSLSSPRFGMFSDRTPTHVGEVVSATVEAKHWATVEKSLRSLGIPPACAMMAAAAAASRDVFGGVDVRIGTAMSNRWSPESRLAIGLFATFNVVRFRPSITDTVLYLARSATAAVYESVSLAPVPLSDIVDELRARGETFDGTQSLYQLTLAYSESTGAMLRAGNLELRVMRGAELPDDTGPAYSPLHVEGLLNAEKSLQLFAQYDSGLIDSKDADEWISAFADGLAALGSELQ